MPESNTPNNKPSEEPPSGLVVDFVNRQTRYPIQQDRLREVAHQILVDAGYSQGHLSLAVVDDSEMHQLNRQYLQHDYPTDVLSFLLEETDERVEARSLLALTRRSERRNVGVGSSMTNYCSTLCTARFT